MWHIKLTGIISKNRIQVKFSLYGQTGVHGVRSKGQILLNFNYKDFLYQIVCVFSQKRYINISTRLFILWPAPCTSGVTWGCWGSKTWTWRFAMMPNQLHVLITYSSGLDTDVEQLYIIFIVNVNSLKFPPTLIHTNSLC